MVTCKPYVVGIDCGGTNTVMGIVDSRGKVVAKNAIKTKAYIEFNDFIDAIARSLSELFEQVGGPQMITGIGIGAPNGNYYTGTIEYAPNLPWKGILPLADALYERLGIPVAVTNDANAAAIGEMTYGAARGMRDFIEITLGTGVGSGIVINGELVYGHDGFAGELGHVRIRHNGNRLCGCGMTDHLECYCSATGVARTAREFLATRVFGGLANAGDLLMKPIVKAMEENLLQIWKGKIKVLPSGLASGDAAVLGASALGWKAKNEN